MGLVIGFLTGFNPVAHRYSENIPEKLTNAAVVLSESMWG